MLTTFVLCLGFTCTFSLPNFDNVIHLQKISTLYLPYRYDNSTPKYRYNSGTVEQSTYDPDNKIVYVVGGRNIHAIDIHDPTSPKIIYHRQFDDVDITDVDFCGSYLFVAMHNLKKKQDGRVLIFHTLSTTQPMKIKHDVTVGSHPDMLVSTKNCTTILVAVEGEPFVQNGSIVDPEGGVGIIRIDSDITYKFLNFRHFNTRWSGLESKGLRFIYRENNNTFANDVEPEYISFNKDETKAYICLQENNGIAVLDMLSETMDVILPLGYKSWETARFDASDKDNGINIKSWPVFGIYQPDAIRTIEHNGHSYLVTANEGGAKNYIHPNGIQESILVSNIIISEKSPVMRWANQHNVSGIQEKQNLGRLEISSLHGKNIDGSYRALYAFGGRGFSIWQLDSMDLVYDSGSQFEDMHKLYFSSLFNVDGGKNAKTVKETFDSRSDNKGPECESIAVAYIGDMILLFIGSERPGSIAIYKIEHDVAKPKFQSIWMGIEDTDGTWEQLYEKRKLSEIDPEDVRYISPDDSPTGDHMLLVAGTVSGTLSLFRINGIPYHLRKSPSNTAEGIQSVIPVTILFVIIYYWLHI